MNDLLAYQERGKTYYADTCKPLVDAWNAGAVNLEAWARHHYPGYKMPDNILPNVNSLGYWDAQHEQDWGLDWHRNEGIEITFLESGTVPFSLGDQAFDLYPNDLTITRPWQPHKVGNPHIGAGKLHWVILDVEVRHPHQEWCWPSWVLLNRQDKEELTKMLRQNEQPIWKANAAIKKCFQKIAGLITADHTMEGESWVYIYLNELLMHLLTLFRQGAFSYDEALTESVRTVELFIHTLRNNFTDPWTLPLMAENCHMGITRFVHYFKQLTNSTPMGYLNSVRLKEANKLLCSEPFKNINQIGYQCGFSSSQYFATAFKKEFGNSPHAHRKKHAVT